jgi:hypothetical protein
MAPATTATPRQTANDHDPRRRRSRITLGLVALASVMLAACAPSTRGTAVPGASGTPATAASAVVAPDTPFAAHGVEAAISDVPWSKVGPGWMLAEWSPVTPHMPGGQRAPDEPTSETATTTLYLVDPMGNRYTITTFAPGGSGAPKLLDWSADGSHALLVAKYPAPPTVTSLDLHNGTQSTIAVEGYPSYAGPDGNSLLVSTPASRSEPATLTRTDLSGHAQMSYPTDQLGTAGQFNGGYLESRDGTQLVLGTGTLFYEPASASDNHLVVMSNDGKIIRTLPPPMPKARCSPAKWWSATVILTHCASNAGSQLWKMPLDGGAPTALTAVNSGEEDDPGFGRDIGDGDVWQLPSGTFLQSTGACGSMFLSRLTPDMHTTRVKVPGVSENIGVAGVTGDTLLLLAQVGCSGTTSLLTYDPAANTSTVLLGPPVNGGGVSEALLYPGKT